MIIYCNTLTKKLDKPIEKTPEEENRNMDKLVEKRKLGRPISDYDRKRAVRIMNRLLRGPGLGYVPGVCWNFLGYNLCT